MSEMRVLTEEGDLKLNWDSENDDEVEAAKKMFNEYTEKGWKAYKGGRRGQVMTDFERDAEKIILLPPIMGG